MRAEWDRKCPGFCCGGCFVKFKESKGKVTKLSVLKRFMSKDVKYELLLLLLFPPNASGCTPALAPPSGQIHEDSGFASTLSFSTVVYSKLI